MFSAGTEPRAGSTKFPPRRFKNVLGRNRSEGWAGLARTVCERERRGAEEVDVQVAGLADPAHPQQTCQYH